MKRVLEKSESSSIGDRIPGDGGNGDPIPQVNEIQVSQDKGGGTPSDCT